MKSVGTQRQDRMRHGLPDNSLTELAQFCVAAFGVETEKK